MSVVIVAWLILALLVGHLARGWGRDRFEWTASALLLSPLLVGVALLVVPPPTSTGVADEPSWRERRRATAGLRGWGR
jgi:hypothetical protein